MAGRTPRRPDDRGQALPVYVTVIGALLFLAFAYFAVGQAAATRSGAQTAADAAALAAVTDQRDQLRDGLLGLLGGAGSLDDLGRVLDGHLPGLRDSCDRAARFAADNRAHTTDCHRTGPPAGYAVTVETDHTVGRSVVAGTEDRHAHAEATAVLIPLCSWDAAPPTARPSPSPDPSASAGPPPGPGPSGPPPSPGTLRCRGLTWVVDPAHLDDLPPAADLFAVRLTD